MAATGASNVEVRTTAAQGAGPIFTSQASDVDALCQTFQQKVNGHCAVDGSFTSATPFSEGMLNGQFVSLTCQLTNHGCVM